jgi:predicted TPR repeat methyltransferase
VSAPTALQRAIAAHKGGRLTEAEVAYRRILRARPGDPDALNFLGMLCVQKGNPAEGTEYLGRSVKSAPGNPHAWLNFGNALMARGEIEAAGKAFRTATELAPTMAEAWFNRGVCARRLKLPEEALEYFGKAVEHGPGYTAAYEAMASLLYRAGRTAEAASAYREWLKHDPGNSIARHMLAASSGEGVPARAADDYLAAMFDQFAASFDENLQELGYRAPQLLASALERRAGQARFDILDAGCGTGLCGPLLRPMARSLTGVDISGGMIEKARERGIYQTLVVQELTGFMRSRPSAFDVVISADTLVYFGALDEALSAAYACLRRPGVLAFTAERLEPGPAGERHRLEPHGRYSHSEAYLRESLAAVGFTAVELTPEILRRERGEEVRGHVVLATR